MFSRMAGWGSLTGVGETDFLTRYMTQSCSPIYRVNNSELQFSPSPTKSTVQSFDNTANMTAFCGEHNVEDCLAYLNKVGVADGWSLYCCPTKQSGLIPVVIYFKAKIYPISSNTHQLQFIKLHHFTV